MRSKIIIDRGEGVTEDEAMEAVLRVIRNGRLSQSRGIPHYCWLSVMGRLQVSTRRKDHANAADSFIVLKPKESP